MSLTSSKSRERTHKASIDTTANGDSLLSVIWDLFDQLQFAETRFRAGNSIGAV